MSVLMATCGSAWNSSQLHPATGPSAPRSTKSQLASGGRGVGPAESTGKSGVSYWPGGSRPAVDNGCRRPRNAREMNESVGITISLHDELNRRAYLSRSSIARIGPTAMLRVCHANALVKQASDWRTRSSRVRTGVGQTSPCCNDDSVLLSRHRCAGHTSLPGDSCPARRLHSAKTFPTTTKPSEEKMVQALENLAVAD